MCPTCISILNKARIAHTIRYSNVHFFRYKRLTKLILRGGKFHNVKRLRNKSCSSHSTMRYSTNRSVAVTVRYQLTRIYEQYYIVASGHRQQLAQWNKTSQKANKISSLVVEGGNVPSEYMSCCPRCHPRKVDQALSAI